jgi:hypothetical protein
MMAQFIWVLVIFKRNEMSGRFATALSTEDADRLVKELISREGIHPGVTYEARPEITNHLLFKGCYNGPKQPIRRYDEAGELVTEERQ